MTPTADGMVGVVAARAAGRALRRRARGDPANSPPGCAAPSRRASCAAPGPFRQHTRARTAGRVLLVGDASGYVDALTGEGIRIGFDAGARRGRRVRAGDPAGYETARGSAITRDFRRLTGALVRLGDLAAAPALIVPIVERGCPASSQAPSSGSRARAPRAALRSQQRPAASTTATAPAASAGAP